MSAPTNIPKMPLETLYQEVILDHNRKPRNFAAIEKPDVHAQGHNPLCGDEYEVFLTIKDGKIEKVGFKGHGCAISKASASMMTTKIKDKSLTELEKIKNDFLSMITEGELSEDKEKTLGSLKIFKGVHQFPIRVKCATLIWRALEEGLKQIGE